MTKDVLLDIKTQKALQKLANEMLGIRKDLRIGTNSLTPLNYQSEMEKFFKSNTYNPKYIYNRQGLPDYSKIINKLKLEISKEKFPTDISIHLIDYLDNQEKVYKTKKSIGEKNFSKNANDLFDWDPKKLDFLLSKTLKPKFKMHTNHTIENATEIKKRFQKTLRDYKIEDFKVKIDNFSTHIIYAGYKSIHIGAAIKRYQCNVDRLIIHEIESHALQTENLKRATTPLVDLATYKNQNLYAEGLAVFNEIMTRKITLNALEMYFHRVKAVSLLDKSFREIFEILAKDLPMKRAYVMTYRVKRGMADTSKPGGFPKDACYLLGFYEIERMVNEGFDKKLLYATKSPVLTQLLLKYSLTNPKKLLIPKFYH